MALGPAPGGPLAAAASRLSNWVYELRALAARIEEQHPTTVVQLIDPAAQVMPAGTLWVNSDSARIFVSNGAGAWVSADAQRKTAFIAPEACTADTAGLYLGGPAVSVYVPPGGIVGFYVDAEIKAGTSGAGTFAGVIHIEDSIDIPGSFVVLQSLSTTYDRRITAPGSTFGTTFGYGAWIVHRATPGWHTYALRYSSAGGGATVCFRSRRLVAATF